MTDLHNPWGESLPLDPDAAARLLSIVSAWKLDDPGVAFLHQIRLETWVSLRESGSTPLDRETRMRVGHVIDMSDAMDALEPEVDQAEWLRRPHDILRAFAPLDFLLVDEEALRSMRFTMMMDAYPGFPDVKSSPRAADQAATTAVHGDAPSPGPVGFAARVWRLLRPARRPRD